MGGASLVQRAKRDGQSGHLRGFEGLGVFGGQIAACAPGELTTLRRAGWMVPSEICSSADRQSGGRSVYCHLGTKCVSVWALLLQFSGEKSRVFRPVSFLILPQ